LLVADIAYDSYDLGRFRSIPHLYSLPERILVAIELPGHGFADDGDGRASGIVVLREVVKKYFGDENPLGRLVNVVMLEL
jgi:hypothetical protein